MPSATPHRAPFHHGFGSSASIYWALFVGNGSAASFQNVLAPKDLPRIADQAMELGLGGIVLYPFAPTRDDQASALLDDSTPLYQALRVLNESKYTGSILVDLCVCQYVADAHCRLSSEGCFDIKRTVEHLVQAGRMLVESGASGLMPSASLPELTGRLRTEFQRSSRDDVLLIPQSAKFQSQLYSYFRTATGQQHMELLKPYQINPEDWDNALVSCQNDLKNGADAVLVKPALQFREHLEHITAVIPASVGVFLTSAEHGMLIDLSKRSSLSLETLYRSVLAFLVEANSSFLVSYQAPAFSKALSWHHDEQKIPANY